MGDLIFAGKGHSLTKSNVDALLSAASTIFEYNVTRVKVASHGVDSYDGPFIGHVPLQSDTDVVALTGGFRLKSGWLVMVDLALSVSDGKMSRPERICKIIFSLEKGDFAKALQRIRHILSKTRKPVF